MKAIAVPISRSEGSAGICLEAIEAYAEGAISTQRVYLQGPEANRRLRAFPVSGDEIGTADGRRTAKRRADP